MASRSPIMMTLPPFHGMTRRIVLTAAVAWFVLTVVGLVLPDLAGFLRALMLLVPDWIAQGHVWSLPLYPFVPTGLVSELFACLSIWFFANAVEEERGSSWLLEYFLTASIVGGLLASAFECVVGPRIPGLPRDAMTGGLWPAVLAILLAYARMFPEMEIRFNFLIGVKAKYLAVLYVLFYLGAAIVGQDRFSAVVAVCNALAGFLYLRFAPRRGLRFAASEGWFGLRNRWYKAKRRRAAKKFEVYMREHGRDVRVGEDEGKWRN